ncbi:MAG TPA: NUDIX hydrolase [Candidatus Paceibacterota bacterium]
MKKQMKLPKLVSGPKELIPMSWQKTMLGAKFKNSPKGKPYDYSVFHSPSICQVVLPLTTKGEVVVCRQFRYGIAINNSIGPVYDPSVLELPAGGPEKSESYETAAQKELLEETGWKPRQMIRLATIIWFDPASTTLRFVPWLAIGCQKIAKHHHDSTESIQVQTISWKKWLKLIEDGDVTTSHSIVTTMLASIMIESGKLDRLKFTR